MYNKFEVIILHTASIIAEYNPFHNGHKYQIDEIKKQCQRVIAIMSGPFVQRGDVAITDKWTRAKAAVLGGCDLVIELPVCYALKSARDFALGALSILDRLKVCDTLCFGAECGDISTLSECANILSNETEDISYIIKEYVSNGYSYPIARSKAFSGTVDNSLLSEPNNILAIEYLMAIKALKSNIKPYLIQRTGVGHDEIGENNNIASASYIRELIHKNKDFYNLVPESAFNVYKNALADYDINNLSTLIIGYLRLIDENSYSSVNDLSDDLKIRIIESARTACDFNDLVSKVKSKCYTMSRIRRVVLSMLLDIKKDYNVNYIRVLAMNDTGKEILREIKEKSELDIIVKTALYKKNDDSFKLDLRASDIFSLATADKPKNFGGADFLNSPVIL